MNGQTIRDTFVRFYAERGHEVVPAAPLVPLDDPSLLFNSAGMVQFKPLYTTADPLPYRRAVSVQPCLRAGGKDSDIENVGRTPRHLSFFEMLGNFSFGDYFKEQAIEWGWELITRTYGIDPDRLWVTVYEKDDEAAEIWRTKIGLPSERVVRLGKADNFWGPAGRTGACGPCSEIYYDFGPEFEGTGPGDDGDRFMEFYNLVFPQYDMQEDGDMAPLRNRGIDTGLGLERLALILQGGETVFDTDLFTPIITRIAELADTGYGDGTPEVQRSMRVIADHIRGLTFSVAEGVMPSNEGRGYVLRRILRRAVRRALFLGLDEPFLDTLSGVVVDHYQTQYPLLHDARERVALTLHAEEERFEKTLGTGIARFEEAAARARQAGQDRISGETVFTLYDTYGFPVDMIEEMAAERELGVDIQGFQSAMVRQKERSRVSSKFDPGEEDTIDWVTVSNGDHSAFTGYESTEEDARVRRWARADDRLLVVLDRTPFYAESGGQVGDTGELIFPKVTLPVRDTVRRGDAIVHVIEEPDGLDPDAVFADAARARLDAGRRADIQRNHTATHLLHAALRDVLGTHVAQAGSLVAPDRLRFDFSHFQPMTPDEIRAVEEQVNREILGDAPVESGFTTLEEALADGAMALFGEKYGDRVRQVVVPGYSRELCGGTHVGATGEVGPFLVVGEQAVAAGTRRVEALTGTAAQAAVRQSRDALDRVAARLQTPRESVEEKIETLLTERAELQKELDRVRAASRRAELGEAMEGMEAIGDAELAVRTIEAKNAGEMRSAADVLRGRLKSGVAILAADTGEKASFLVFVTDDLVKAGKLRADELVREVAAVAGGSGGGKPGLALAGAKDVSRIPDALEHGRRLVRQALNRERTDA